MTGLQSKILEAQSQSRFNFQENLVDINRLTLLFKGRWPPLENSESTVRLDISRICGNVKKSVLRPLWLQEERQYTEGVS